MKNITFILLAFTIFMGLQTSTVNAANDYLSVTIISPAEVNAYPGYETVIQAEVTNNTSTDLSNLVAYITMVDLTKNMTVNLEDYNADVPLVIDNLKANETITIDLPIILVYPDHFHLYVSVASLDTMSIVTSESINSTILTQSNIDPTIVMVASSVMPAIVLILFTAVYFSRKKQIALTPTES